MLTVVTGPPCSGKSTYVREHARPGDIIVDFDVLAQALGNPTPHDPPDAIRWTAVMARRAAVLEAINQHRKGATAWIIHGSIPRPDLERYEREGAELIHLTATPAELHARVDKAGRPARWHRLVDEWTPIAEPRPAKPRAPRGPRQPGISHTDPQMRKGRKGRPYRRWREDILTRSTICWICGHPGADSADHIVPLTRGGAPLDPDNGAPAHYHPCPTCGRRCNQSRGARPGRGVDAAEPVAQAEEIRADGW